MNSAQPYAEIAESYVDAVRVLLAPPGVETGERGGHGPTSAEDLAQKAESLLPLSKNLAGASAPQIEAPDPEMRNAATTRLLAQALTDLTVSSHLYEAGTDVDEGAPWLEATHRERTVVPSQEEFRILLGTQLDQVYVTERGSPVPRDSRSAKIELKDSVDEALVGISSRSASTGKAALGGVLGLGAAELTSVVGSLSLTFADAVGVAHKVNQLYQLAERFAIRTYESVAALLGPTVLQQAGVAVLQWVEELKAGMLANELVERLYGIDDTREGLAVVLDNAEAELQPFVSATVDVDRLLERYTRQVDLAEKILRGVRRFGGVPAAVLPQGRVVLIATNVAIGGYVVLAGADYVDSGRLKLLNRVQGVRRVVELHLQLS